MPTTMRKNGSSTAEKSPQPSNAGDSTNQVPQEGLQLLDVNQLLPASDNRRRAISDASVRSLAQSIRENGVLQPIIVRSHPTEPHRWEIRAGERRWRAAQLAGLSAIPAIIRSLDDEEALAVTLVENLQRQDLHPLEEAATVQHAIDGGFDLKALASKLGRTVPHLVRRASLTRLTHVWQQAIRRAGSDLNRLSPAHLELIARLPPATQNKLAEENFAAVFGRGFPTVDELRCLIDDDLQQLSAMPWKLDDETLEPKAGACTNCEKRSSRQHLLFPELGSSGKGADRRRDRCLDPNCFQTKQVGHLKRCEAKLRERHPELQLIVLGTDELSPRIREAFADRLRPVYYPRFVKAGAERAKPAMPLNGTKLGKLVHLELGTTVNGQSNGRQSRPRDENGKAIPLTMDERRARLQKRREAFAVARVRTILEQFTADQAVALIAPPKGKRPAKALSVFDCLTLLLAFGSFQRADSILITNGWAEFDQRDALTINDQAVAALRAVIEVWIRRLSSYASDHVAAQAADARRMCDLLNLDYAQFMAEAIAAIPGPKSWPKPNDGVEVPLDVSGEASV